MAEKPPSLAPPVRSQRKSHECLRGDGCLKQRKDQGHLAVCLFFKAVPAHSDTQSPKCSYTQLLQRLCYKVGRADEAAFVNKKTPGKEVREICTLLVGSLAQFLPNVFCTIGHPYTDHRSQKYQVEEELGYPSPERAIREQKGIPHQNATVCPHIGCPGLGGNCLLNHTLRSIMHFKVWDPLPHQQDHWDPRAQGPHGLIGIPSPTLL